jgi:hypothetical protein
LSGLATLYQPALLGTGTLVKTAWGVNWLGLPLLPFALGFWLVVLVNLIRHSLSDQSAMGRRLLAGVALTLIIAFVFTPFGADPSGRYFLPLAIPLSLFAADWVVSMQDSEDRVAAARGWRPIAYSLWEMSIRVGLPAWNNHAI